MHQTHRAPLLIVLVFIVGAIAGSPVAETADRNPVPDEKAIEASIGSARKLFAALYASRDPEKNRELIDTLLKNGRESPAGSADQFALLQEASRLAFRVADTVTAFKAVDALAQSYEVSGVRLKLELLEQISSRAPLPQLQRSHQALEFVADALAEGDDRLAQDALGLAQRSAKLARATGLARFLVAEEKWLAEMKQAGADLKTAVETLSTAPDDTTATDVAGNYYALLVGDWGKGLPYLARGANAGLQAAAMAELTNVDTYPEMEQLADLWLDTGKGLKGRARLNTITHAATWLQRAQSLAKGLDRTRLERRQDEALRDGLVAIEGRRGEIITADVHAGHSGPNGSTANSFLLSSPYPVALKKTRIVCAISMDNKPGWTTDGQIEVSFDGEEWKPIGTWNAGIARKAARSGHQISFTAAPQNPVVSEIHVRFRLSKGHTLYISQVLWIHG